MTAMQHRHFKLIASIIAMIEDVDIRAACAARFANELPVTNPAFDRVRFLAAACGQPSNGRDRA